MSDAVASVLWLEHAMEAAGAVTTTTLVGAHHHDVAIVGGGYTGLWSALEVRRRSPDLRVAVVEASSCGFGASGRNGGWVVGWLDHLDMLIEQFGPVHGPALARAASDAIAELGERTHELGIDCDFRRAGSCYVASTPAQDGAWAASARSCVAHGFGSTFHELAAGELSERTATPLSLGTGAVQTDTAIVHPGKLVRGLRRVAVERGVDVFERSPVVRLDRGRPLRVVTTAGSVTAARVILALGAWSPAVRELRGAVLPFASHAVATAPAPDRLSALGIQGPLAAADAQLLVSYLQTTADGRIVFGRGSGPVGARVRRHHFGVPREQARVVSTLRRWYPQLAGVPVTHAWAGPVDVAAGYFPFAGRSGDGRIAYACGYSGDGVAQSLMLSKIAVSLALGENDGWSGSPLASGPRRRFPAPPLAAAAGRGLHSLVRRGEDREEESAELPAWSKAVRGAVRRRL